MRILYYFPELYTPMYFWQRAHIVDELERHNVTVDTFNPLIYGSYDEANEELLKAVSSAHYDLFLTCLCSEKMLYFQTLDRIKGMGIPTVSFRPDNLTIPYNDRNLAPEFDLVWLTSQETRHLYDKWNVRTVFQPYAANPYALRYTPGQILRKACFIGTPYGSRSLMINRLTSANVPVDAFCKPNPELRGRDSADLPPVRLDILLQSRMEVYLSDLRYREGRKMLLGALANKVKGSTALRPNGYLTTEPFVSFDDLASNYSRYALCLSSTSSRHTDALRNPVKIINLRAFEIPMSGGVAFCKYNPELAGYFDDGREIVFYNDDSEMEEKARFYLERASDSELRIMKESARRRAENEHTWWNRFTRIFDILGLKYE